MLSTPYSRVALVTGVGRADGLGVEICRQLARQPMTVLLSARTFEKAKPLAAELQREGYDVRPCALNVGSPRSIEQVVAQLRREFGRLDILVNNAAGRPAPHERAATASLSLAHSIMETTLYGTWQVTQLLLPLLRLSPAGRLVNVSCGAGSHADPVFGLRTYNPAGAGYAVAKAALNALTAKLAFEEPAPTLRINAACPGFLDSFAGGENLATRTVEQGAASIVWAALLPEDGPTGGFFRDGQPVPW